MSSDDSEDYGGGYCEPESCAPSCYSEPCDSGCSGLFNAGGFGGGQCFVTAEYLNVRASFSEATAYVKQDLNAGSDQFIPLQFDYDSSYRVGGGWRSCCCGDQIRFMYTQMTSDAWDTALPGDIVPYETAPPPEGRTNIRANVDARTLDQVGVAHLGGDVCGQRKGVPAQRCGLGGGGLQVDEHDPRPAGMKPLGEGQTDASAGPRDHDVSFPQFHLRHGRRTSPDPPIPCTPKSPRWL